MTPAFWFSFVFPFLLLLGFGQRVAKLLGKNPKGALPTFFLASASAVLVSLPVGGLPAGRWLISLFPNPSIPLTGLLFSWVLKRSFQVVSLDTRALRTCFLFSIMAGVALYPMALGVGPFDPYSAGWHFSWLFVSLLAITLGMIFMKNRFSIVLLSTILAYDFHLLESGNLWDYLIDPILVLISIGGLISQMAKGRRSRFLRKGL